MHGRFSSVYVLCVFFFLCLFVFVVFTSVRGRTGEED